jgi:RNA 2',3'-cyclic 3'-phosphodiesterase
MSRDGSTARLFAAVDPPPAVRHELSSWAREAAGAMRAGTGLGADGAAAKVRVLAPDTLHVTLCFLGSRPVEEIDALAAALGRCDVRGGEASLGAPLWLPPREPRSLALEVHDGPRGWLGALHRSVSEAFAQTVDWEPERRRFRPHLTVARLGRAGKPSRGARSGRSGRGRQGSGRAADAGPDAAGSHGEALPLPPTPQLTFAPAEVVLYRSWLDPQGASYEPIATRTLAAGSPSPSSSSCGDEDVEPFVP